ncbi:hypothetical protein ES705_45898 [subsurface metagenome]
MEEIFVPKDFSDLRKFLPPNEEVVYSTLCTIRFSYMGISAFNRRVKKRVKYNSHVLITPRGLAYFCRPIDISVKSSELTDLEPRYNTLLNVSDVEGKKFKVFHTDYSLEETTYDFELIQHPNFESNAKFDDRIKKFKMILHSYMTNTAKTFLTYIIENKDQDGKDNFPLWKISKDFFASNRFTLDYDQTTIGEEIELVISKIQSKRIKKREALQVIKELLDKVQKVAYVKYRIKRGELQSFICLKRLYNYSIFDELYLKYLRKLISKLAK